MKYLKLEFQPSINYFYSPNGVGKTNLLEAIQILTIGRSLRAIRQKDILPITGNSQPLNIIGEISDRDGIIFSQGCEIDFSSQIIKTLTINGKRTQYSKYLGNTPSIWFGPENIKILSSSPEKRRVFLDQIMIQLYPTYHLILRNYNRALKQRNKLLKSIKIDKTQMKIWTEQLIKYGSEVINIRKVFFNILNHELTKLKSIDRYEIQVKFKPSIKINPVFDEDIGYTFTTYLQNEYKSDILKQTTTVGPHRDDWSILIKILPSKDFIDVNNFGSRGQQRMSLIILLIAVVELFKSIKNTDPIILLDDILSELDDINKQVLLDFIFQKKIQSFITGVYPIDVPDVNQVNLIKHIHG